MAKRRVCEGCGSNDWAYVLRIRNKRRYACDSCFDAMYAVDKLVCETVESHLLLKSEVKKRMEAKYKLLFVCTANINRSKTGEEIYKDKFETKSAGFLPGDSPHPVRLDSSMLDWADIVVVFEQEHLGMLAKEFPAHYAAKKVINLEIPDIYSYNSETLKDRIRDKLEICMAQLKAHKGDVVEYYGAMENKEVAN